VSAPAITNEQRRVLIGALAQFSDQIASVGVFGSRATGTARENSDIDLVIYGDLDSKSERRLWTILDESNLPVGVDLVVYSRINNPLLKQHIDSVGVPLFMQDDLKQAKKDAVRRI
jgi:uncharacterized protein